MQKQDYVMRMIEQLVRALTDTLGLTQTKDYDGGLATLDRAFQDFFGWNSNFINSMPEAYLIEMMRKGETTDVDGLTVMASLLKAEAEIYEATGQPTRAYHRFLRALHISLTVSESGARREVSDEWDETESLIQALAPYELPAETTRRLWKYHAAQGAYARAEDTFFTLLEQEERAPDIAAEGARFFRALLERSDDALQRGDLPRAEVEETLAELESIARDAAG